MEVVQEHWQKFGRSYYQRHDYEGLDSGGASKMVADLRTKLPGLVGASLAGSTVEQADDFSYTDPVDGSVSDEQGLRILLSDGSRIVARLSGTGTEGATMRLYLERYLEDGGRGVIEKVLQPLVDAAGKLLELRERCGRDRPTLIT
jgi:phosphoglucomutase